MFNGLPVCSATWSTWGTSIGPEPIVPHQFDTRPNGRTTHDTTAKFAVRGGKDYASALTYRRGRSPISYRQSRSASHPSDAIASTVATSSGEMPASKAILTEVVTAARGTVPRTNPPTRPRKYARAHDARVTIATAR